MAVLALYLLIGGITTGNACSGDRGHWNTNVITDGLSIYARVTECSLRYKYKHVLGMRSNMIVVIWMCRQLHALGDERDSGLGMAW